MKEKKASIFSNKIISAVLAVACCLLWGSAFPCIKVGYGLFNIDNSDYRTQILFAGIRFVISGVMVVIFGSFIEKKPLLPSKKSIPNIFILAIFQTVAQYIFFYIGLANTSGITASVFSGSGSLFIIAIACLVKQDKLSVKKGIGCALGFGGVIVAALGQNANGGFSFLGEGFILLSSLSYGASIAMLKSFSKKENPVALSGYQFFVGGLIMIIVGLALGGRITQISVGGVMLLLYLAFVSAGAYTVWGLLLKHNPVSKIAVFGFVIPIAGSLFSAIFLKEYSTVGWQTLVALALISLGIFVVNYKKPDKIK